MTTFDITNSLKAYYNFKLLSDVTVKFGEHKIKAHKIILCQGSEFFRASFTGRFKEAETSTIELHDDRPQAVERLLEHLYGYSWTIPNLAHVAQTPSVFEQYVDAYIVGNKYLAPTFRDIAEQHLLTVVREMWSRQKRFELFGHLVQNVYITHEEAAIDLRLLLIDSFATKVVSMEDPDEDWRSLLLEVPEFGFEVLEKLLGRRAVLESDLKRMKER